MTVNDPIWLVIPREPKHAKSMQSCHYIVRTMKGWVSAKNKTKKEHNNKSGAYWMELCLICTNPLEFQLLYASCTFKSLEISVAICISWKQSSKSLTTHALSHWTIFSSCCHFLKTSMAINKSLHSVNHFPDGESFLTCNKSFPGSG